MNIETKYDEIDQAFSFVKELGYPVPNWRFFNNDCNPWGRRDIPALFSPCSTNHSIFFNWSYIYEDEIGKLMERIWPPPAEFAPSNARPLALC